MRDCTPLKQKMVYSLGVLLEPTLSWFRWLPWLKAPAATFFWNGLAVAVHAPRNRILITVMHFPCGCPGRLLRNFSSCRTAVVYSTNCNQQNGSCFTTRLEPTAVTPVLFLNLPFQPVEL